MYSFIISIVALVLGYIFYGRFVERVFGPNPRRITPAIAKEDGVDYVPMPAWKVYMIQFLNIAGTGPIFGAIMGAKFGPSCYLWIVFGCIFAGAVHDYLSGMLSLRYLGASLPTMLGHYIGDKMRVFLSFFLAVFMILVGAVFVYSPALILGDLAGIFSSESASIMFWIFIIFAYYIVATLLPVDKIIGKIYPLFAFALIFMALAMMVCLLAKWPSIPELWDGLQNRGPSVGVEGQSIFPCLFITVACGAVSGFHATQSPIMARCIKNERYGRPVFYGSMITEGIIALIWAAVSSYFFFDGGMAECGATGAQAPEVVTSVAKSWLGVFGGILAILGVVAAPITSGDTAFRSARIILADYFKLDQRKKANRLYVSIPLFAGAALLLWFNIADENGFNIIWRYFGWMNQTLSCFTLWALTIWLTRHSKKPHFLVSLIPAAFMTSVCITYICIDRIGFHIPASCTPYIATTVFVACIVFGIYLMRKNKDVYETLYIND
ncbi:MAG: carbon starvation protein A [Bacteroidia bacterium]|nr:carbon starvation protein A [Bacteroidia bacterium]